MYQKTLIMRSVELWEIRVLTRLKQILIFNKNNCKLKRFPKQFADHFHVGSSESVMHISFGKH